MPFSPLPEQSSDKPKSSDFGLFLIRCISVLAFFYYQLIDQLNQARLFIWEKAEWRLVDQIAEMGLPLPGVIATVFILLLAVSLLGLAGGIFTRINALILFALTTLALISPIDLSATLNRQAIVLYLALFLSLACGGAGRVSLDFFMTRRARKKPE
ncbi:MAG: hypothetical protein AAGA96_14070 [Verrucomicrobiota bacterium]